MKFTVPQDKILPVLQQCAAVADRKGTMPALSNVLIYANGAINLSATDLYQSVTADTDGTVKDQGSIAVDARQLLDRVKVLTGEISFAVNGNALTLKSGSRRFTLQTIPGEEMPKLPDHEGATDLLAIGGEALASLIARVQFAISTDETRLHLNSLLLEQDGDKLTAAATDGHRLSVAAIQRDYTAAAFKILLPLKGVLQLKRLCEGADEVTLRQTGLTLFVEAGGYSWSCKLSDSAFPPYRDVIPTNLTGHATIDRLSLLSALKAVSVAASDRTGGVKLSFGGEAIKLSSESPEGGESMDEISCEYSGPGGDVGVNARYLIEALGAMESERVVIGSAGELDPLTIKAEGDESGSVAVVMPCRL